APALVSVDHGERGLGDRPGGLEADEASHAQALGAPGGDDGEVVMAVHLGEVAELPVEVVAARDEEAEPSGLDRQPGEDLAEPVLVVGSDEPEVDRATVVENNLFTIPRSEAHASRSEAASVPRRAQRELRRRRRDAARATHARAPVAARCSVAPDNG